MVEIKLLKSLDNINKLMSLESFDSDDISILSINLNDEQKLKIKQVVKNKDDIIKILKMIHKYINIKYIFVTYLEVILNVLQLVLTLYILFENRAKSNFIVLLVLRIIFLLTFITAEKLDFYHQVKNLEKVIINLILINSNENFENIISKIIKDETPSETKSNFDIPITNLSHPSIEYQIPKKFNVMVVDQSVGVRSSKQELKNEMQEHQIPKNFSAVVVDQSVGTGSSNQELKNGMQKHQISSQSQQTPQTYNKLLMLSWQKFCCIFPYWWFYKINNDTLASNDIINILKLNKEYFDFMNSYVKILTLGVQVLLIFLTAYNVFKSSNAVAIVTGVISIPFSIFTLTYSICIKKGTKYEKRSEQLYKSINTLIKIEEQFKANNNKYTEYEKELLKKIIAIIIAEDEMMMGIDVSMILWKFNKLIQFL